MRLYVYIIIYAKKLPTAGATKVSDPRAVTTTNNVSFIDPESALNAISNVAVCKAATPTPSMPPIVIVGKFVVAVERFCRTIVLLADALTNPSILEIGPEPFRFTTTLLPFPADPPMSVELIITGCPYGVNDLIISGGF